MRVRSKRTQDRYFVDNALIREHGATIRSIGIAVYNVLALHADLEDQNAWPSYETIAKLIGCSRSSVIRTMKQLVELKIIVKCERNGRDGGQTSNEYFLIDKKVWTPPPVQPDTPPVPEEHPNNPHDNNPHDNNTVPSEPDAGTPSAPITMDGWLDLIEKANNKVAALHFMYRTLFPNHDVPDYKYVGRVARDVGGHPRLGQLLWIACGYRPTGDALRYVKGMNKPKGSRGRKSNFEQTWENLMGEELQQ